MKSVILFIGLLVIVNGKFLPEAEFSFIADFEAGYNGVVDISNYQGTDLNFNAAYSQGGIRGIIGKATQGVTYRSPPYNAQRSAATAAGMLWGAYHFGTGDDAVSQAQFFLDYAQPDSSTLLALDFEGNPDGSSMSLSQAEEFVNYVQQKTGRWPVLYGGGYMKTLLRGEANGTLSNCPLWLSDYNFPPTLPPGWNQYTFWQYTNGSAGVQPHTTPGFGATDKDYYYGSPSGLSSFWTGSFFDENENVA